MFNWHRKSGFTLLELLVVIAIIGLLASIVLASVQQARAHARDTRRKTDLSEITKALELYHESYGGYPTSAWSDVEPTADYTIFDSLCGQANFAKFMTDCPHDPKYPNSSCYNAEYVYISDSFRDPADLAEKYVLYATLEDQSSSNLSGSGMDFNMTNVWPCAGYGTPNYRVGEYN